jgi:hypothetical protein
MPSPQPIPCWNDALLRDPHHVRDKRQRVQRMFAAIAPSYDLNNRLHSLWMDQAWRRKAVKLATLKAEEIVSSTSRAELAISQSPSPKHFGTTMIPARSVGVPTV